MTRSSLLTASTLALLSVVTACADETKTPTPADVRARLGSDLENILDQAVAANDGTVMKLAAPAFLGQVIGLGSPRSTESFFAPADGEDESADFDPQQIIDQLDHDVFTDANEVEPGIYAVPATYACGEADPTGPDDDHASCVQNWSQIMLRIRVSENDSDELRFALQIGAQHDEPLWVTLTHTALSVSVDLNEAEDAIQTVATALGEDAPHAQLSGAVTGVLGVLGTAHVALDLTVDRDLSVAVADQGVDLAGPDAFRFATTASHVLHLELDGTAAVGNLALDVGATTAQVPDGGDSETGTDTFGIDLPGVTANATLTDGHLSLTNVSLGDRSTRLLQNGATAVAIDLDKDNGRRFAATLTDDGAGGATVAVQPTFDLRIAVDHTVLGDVMQTYDVTRVLLTGALHGSKDSDAIEVESGTLSVETDPASYGFTANAGQCVTGEDIYNDETFTSYTQWTVRACQ